MADKSQKSRTTSNKPKLSVKEKKEANLRKAAAKHARPLMRQSNKAQ